MWLKAYIYGIHFTIRERERGHKIAAAMWKQLVKMISPDGLQVFLRMMHLCDARIPWYHGKSVLPSPIGNDFLWSSGKIIQLFHLSTCKTSVQTAEIWQCRKYLGIFRAFPFFCSLVICFSTWKMKNWAKALFHSSAELGIHMMQNSNITILKGIFGC